MFNVIYCFLCKRKRSFAGYIGNVLMKYALQLKWVAPTGQDARAQQGRGERSQPLHVAQRGHSNPAANFTRYGTTPRKPPRRGGGRGSADRRVVAVKGRLPPAHVAASAPQRGLQQPTSKPAANLT